MDHCVSTSQRPGTPTGEHSPYWQAVAAEDERLGRTLASIRADYDAGHLTIREAADNRVAALECHLAALAAHRRTFLADVRDDPDPADDDDTGPGPWLGDPDPADPDASLPPPNFYPADGPAYSLPPHEEAGYDCPADLAAALADALAAEADGLAVDPAEALDALRSRLGPDGRAYVDALVSEPPPLSEAEVRHLSHLLPRARHAKPNGPVPPAIFLG